MLLMRGRSLDSGSVSWGCRNVRMWIAGVREVEWRRCGWKEGEGRGWRKVGGVVKEGGGRGEGGWMEGRKEEERGEEQGRDIGGEGRREGGRMEGGKEGRDTGRGTRKGEREGGGYKEPTLPVPLLHCQ